MVWHMGKCKTIQNKRQLPDAEKTFVPEHVWFSQFCSLHLGTCLEKYSVPSNQSHLDRKNELRKGREIPWGFLESILDFLVCFMAICVDGPKKVALTPKNPSPKTFVFFWNQSAKKHLVLTIALDQFRWTMSNVSPFMWYCWWKKSCTTWDV